MDLASRVQRNSLFALVSSVVRLATGFLVFVGIARLHGREAFGQFTTAYALSTFFLVFADLGLDMLLSLEVAGDRAHANAIFRRYAGLKVLVALTATVLMVVVPLFKAGEDSVYPLVVILAGSTFFTTLMNFFFALFKGFEALHHETRITAQINFLSLALLILLGVLHAPLYAFAFVFTGTRFVGFFMARRRAKSEYHIGGISLDMRGLRSIAGKAGLFAAYVTFGYLYFQMDTVILAAMKGSSAVGTYQAVFKIVALALVLPDIIVNAVLPTLSHLYVESVIRWRELGDFLNRALLLCALPIAFVLFSFPGPILSLLYGEDTFPDAVPILRVFAVIVFVRFAVEMFGLLLTTSGYQKSRVIIIAAATAVNGALNLLLIPAYGPGGAAVVSLVSNIGVGLAYIVVARRVHKARILDARCVIPLLATGALMLFVHEVPSVSFWYLCPPSVICCALCCIFAGFTQRERGRLLSVRLADIRPQR